MKKKLNVMTFDLEISLKEFELKSGTIELRKFLNLNQNIVGAIEHICSFSHYVNFAETIINGFQIKGSINSVLNHKRFIQSLKNFQEKNHSTWSGHFTYQDSKNSFIFYAPDFDLLKTSS